MKWLFAFITSIGMICEAQELALEPVNEVNEEIVALDPSFLTREPLSVDALDLPSPQIEIPHKSVLTTVTLSSLFPGLGHVYLGDMRTAGGLMGAMGAGIGLTPVTFKHKDQFVSNLIVLSSLNQYGVYAAYRDVRNYNQQSGYTYQMPQDGFSDLLWAPFTPKVIQKKEVWGGLLGAMALAAITTKIAFPKDAHIHLSINRNPHLPPIVAFPIGIGEESFFRGFLQSALSEGMTPWGGIALSSLIFGAAHLPNAQLLEPADRWRYYSFSIPLITTLGAYFGWVTMKNHSLKESVALHSWYDFVLFAGTALAEKVTTASATRPRGFAFSLPISF